MYKYEIHFQNDKEPFTEQNNFPDEDSATFAAIQMRERACEKFEEYDPDKTYTENDFRILVKSYNQTNIKLAIIDSNKISQDINIIADKFNNWKNDPDAQEWLKIMMYNLEEIKDVHAEKIGPKGYKSDINVTINITVTKSKGSEDLTAVENIQIKLVSNDKGFNQVEKRKVDAYVKNWHIPEDIQTLLKLYDGELPPRNGSRDSKRMYVDEFSTGEQEKLKGFLQTNLIMIISDVIRGRGRFAAEWTMVINKADGYKWILMAVNEAISIYAGDCRVQFTKTGNIHLGNITLQRKGGDNGTDSANMLQFKADPMILFGKN